MTDHLAVLEELAKEMRYRAGDCYDLSPIDADSWADRITAAIALMRGKSEKPRAYFCPMDYGPGMLMHNDDTATAMMAYFIPKGQVFIPLYEGHPLPAPPKDTADEQ